MKKLMKLARLLPPGQGSIKSMFGCPVLFYRGKMIAGVFEGLLFLRVGESQKEKLIRKKMAQPFRVREREMKQYVIFGRRRMINDHDLSGMVKRAMAALDKSMGSLVTKTRRRAGL